MFKRIPPPFPAVPSAFRSVVFRTFVPCLTMALALSACESPVQSGSGGDPGPPTRLDHCRLTTDDLMVGADWDAIRAIDDPRFLPADEIPADRISSDQRVIGLRIDGESIAIPHGEIWAHEIVNLDRSVELAVTFCPLTGSALAFDREGVNGAPMAVSGFLLHENLVMFDRNAPPMIWAQMSASPLCEDPRAERLSQWPVIELRWESWLALHPKTLVLDGSDGAETSNQALARSGRHAPAETGPSGGAAVSSGADASGGRASSSSRSQRVIGAPSSVTDPGIAFSFARLVDRPGDRQVIPFSYDDDRYVLLWSDQATGGMAYSPRTESGQEVDLVPVEGRDPADGGFLDEATGSLFTLDGRAVGGSLAGAVLVPLAQTYVAYRGPWLDFHPDSRMWGE